MKIYKIILLALTMVSMTSMELCAQSAEDEEVFRRATDDFKQNFRTMKPKALVKLAQEAYNAADRAYGSETQQKYVASYHLGLANILHYKMDAAKKYLKQAVKIAEGFEEEQKTLAIGPLLKLSTVYIRKAKYDNAASSAKRALRIAEKYPEEKNLDKASIYIQIGEAEYRQGRYRHARRRYTKAKEIYIERFGPTDERVKLPDFYIAKTYLTEKKYNRSSEIFSDITESLEGKTADRDQILLSSHAFLVHIFEKTGQPDKATEHCLAIAYANPTEKLEPEKALFKIGPVYPRFAQETGREGYVILEYTVSKSGMVKDVEVLEGKNKDIFKKAAIKTVKQWRYAPAIKDGKPIESKLLHKLIYKMKR